MYFVLSIYVGNRNFLSQEGADVLSKYLLEMQEQP